jgi:probable DNA metabolism protein
MKSLIYDGSFEGLLTSIFEIYEYKYADVHISTQKNAQAVVFGEQHEIVSDPVKAARVWSGLRKKISTAALSQLYKAFLSEVVDIENTLYKYMQYVFANKLSVEHDFSNNYVLSIKQTARKTDREKHRMEAFIRFQLMKDGLYYAICQPDYNVLPLIEKHFKERYADQRWLIYDSTRKYGIYYDLQNVQTVQLNFYDNTENGTNIASIADENEELYQHLWQQYFKSVNIVSRKNTKLHIQHMPKRYWKYVTEKQALLQ